MSGIPDDVKTNAIQDATQLGASLLQSIVSQTETGQLGTFINLTPYDWALVDEIGKPIGTQNTNPKWSKPATAIDAFQMPQDGTPGLGNTSNFILTGNVGIGTSKYSGCFCYYSATKKVNLILAIGYGMFSTPIVKGGQFEALVVFIDGSKIHGDLQAFNEMLNELVVDGKSSAKYDSFSKTLGPMMAYSVGAPTTASFDGLTLQFTASKEALFILEGK